MTPILRFIPSPLRRLLFRAIAFFRLRQKPKHVSVLNRETDTLDCVVAYTKIGGYVVPRSSIHRPAAQKILYGKQYEPDTIKLIADSVGDGDIVHAGAFFGDTIPSLAQCVKNGKVWAFEPNKVSFRCAQMTTLINGYSNVQITNAGLGASVKTVALEVSNPKTSLPHGGKSSIVDAPSDNTEEVQLVTIDQTVPADRIVTVLHLDVEGYEEEALAGALATIKRCRPTILLETVPSQWVEENLKPIGYKHVTQTDKNTVFQV